MLIYCCIVHQLHLNTWDKLYSLLRWFLPGHSQQSLSALCLSLRDLYRLE